MGFGQRRRLRPGHDGTTVGATPLGDNRRGHRGVLAGRSDFAALCPGSWPRLYVPATGCPAADTTVPGAESSRTRPEPANPAARAGLRPGTEQSSDTGRSGIVEVQLFEGTARIPQPDRAIFAYFDSRADPGQLPPNRSTGPGRKAPNYPARRGGVDAGKQPGRGGATVQFLVC